MVLNDLKNITWYEFDYEKLADEFTEVYSQKVKDYIYSRDWLKKKKYHYKNRVGLLQEFSLIFRTMQEWLDKSESNLDIDICLEIDISSRIRYYKAAYEKGNTTFDNKLISKFDSDSKVHLFNSDVSYCETFTNFQCYIFGEMYARIGEYLDMSPVQFIESLESNGFIALNGLYDMLDLNQKIIFIEQ